MRNETKLQKRYADWKRHRDRLAIRIMQARGDITRATAFWMATRELVELKPRG